MPNSSIQEWLLGSSLVGRRQHYNIEAGWFQNGSSRLFCEELTGTSRAPHIKWWSSPSSHDMTYIYNPATSRIWMASYIIRSRRLVKKDTAHQCPCQSSSGDHLAFDASNNQCWFLEYTYIYIYIYGFISTVYNSRAASLASGGSIQDPPSPNEKKKKDCRFRSWSHSFFLRDHHLE